MVAVKSHQADSFLRRLDPRLQAVLCYGSDAGLVAERARGAARAMSAACDPAGEVVRIEDVDLEADPDRLMVELLTVPMFGGRKIVLTRTGRRVTAQSLKPVFGQSSLAGGLVVEAGNLKPDDALRALFEKSATGAAIACYPDEARDLEAIARSAFREAGLDITPRALATLVARLGADRALSRSEIEKLVLYARGKNLVDIEDVDAVVGDASELAIDNVVLAAASGGLAVALAECDRVIASGESPQTIIGALQRHFNRLHRFRAGLEAGRSLDEVLRQARPPIHFRQRPEIERQVRGSNLATLSRALTTIAAAAKRARREPSLETSIAERLLIDLAGLAGRAPDRTHG